MSSSTTLGEIKDTTKGERYLLAVLCYINIINYIDRVGIAAVLVDIQKYFVIGDAQGGLLQTVLLLTYTLSAPIFGCCGDRFSRKWLIVACILTWSLSTVCGAWSGKFEFLLLSRALVGIGQSGFVTIAPTVISDVVLRGARSVFLACFYFGIPIGAGIGYVSTAFVSESMGKWNYGLCVGPVLNILGFILICFAEFPGRGMKEANELGAKSPERISTPLLDDMRYLFRIPTFNVATGAFTVVCFMVGAFSWWMPKVLYYGALHIPGNQGNATTTAVSLYFGILAITTGFVGVLVGLLLSRNLRPKFPQIDPIICGAGLLIAFPFALAGLTSMAISELLTYFCIFFSEVNMNLNWAIFTDILLYVIVPHRRTTAQGFSMLLTHGFGDCISPYIVGFLSDTFKKNLSFGDSFFFLPAKIETADDPNSDAQQFHALQMSLFIVSFILLLGSSLFFIASRYVVADTEKARQGIIQDQK